MIYRRFGKTDLQMPVFSCGGMRYQFKWGEVPADQIPDDNQANLEATIRRSLEVGINHIETARGYCMAMGAGAVPVVLMFFLARLAVNAVGAGDPFEENLRDTATAALTAPIRNGLIVLGAGVAVVVAAVVLSRLERLAGQGSRESQEPVDY